MQRYIVGQGIRQISREEGRARETVAKIVRSEEVQGYIRHLREQFFGLGPEALVAVRHTLEREKDGRLGYRLLMDIGVIPSPEERQLLAARQAEAGTSDDEEVQKILGRLFEGFAVRASAFGHRVPPVLEADLKKAGGKIDYATGEIQPLGDKKPG